MTKKELQDRFKKFAIEVIIYVESLPATLRFKNVQYQIVKSSSSSAANYRAACRGKSTADFLNKLTIVEEELDETLFWLEFIVGLEENERKNVTPYWKEGDELLSIIVATINTVKKNKK